MCKIIEFKQSDVESNLDNLIYLVKNDIKKLNKTIKHQKLDADELCILTEELCRYERIDALDWLLSKHTEILYYHECDILDIAVGTCNIDLIKMILSKFEENYSPEIKYEGSCHRAIENKRKDVLDLLKEHKVNIM